MESVVQDEIIRVIANYMAGKAGAEEITELENWVGASPENRTYFLQIKNIWEVSDKRFSLSNISSEKALKKVLNRFSKDLPKPGIWFYWQKVAAVLFIPVLIASLFWIRHSDNKGSSTSVIYNEVYAAFGTRSALKLADGSQVWLNSGSSLRYPDRFRGKERVVYLKGEAYFEVQSDVSKPFIVQTQTISVKATGTKFNVMAFNTDHLAEVTLVSGKVFVNKADTKGSVLISELRPNQHLVYDTISGKVSLQSDSVYKYISWREGKLIFRNEPLNEVVKKLSKVYQVDIELRGKKLQEYRYRATFEEESLSDILKLLKLSSPIDYHELSRKPLPDGTFPKKKIIIFPLKTS